MDDISITNIYGEKFVINVLHTTLKYSRYAHLEMTAQKRFDDVARGLINSFRKFGSVPKKLLFDNMATVSNTNVTPKSSAFVHTKCSFACWELSPKPSKSIRNLIELPVCFHPFITYIIFASNQAFLPFHKPIPKTDKYINENNPNSLVLKL